MEKDNSKQAVRKAVGNAKAAIRLQGDNQMQKESGYNSAPVPGGPRQSDAVPGGSPGTTGGSNEGK